MLYFYLFSQKQIPDYGEIMRAAKRERENEEKGVSAEERGIGDRETENAGKAS